MPPGAAAGEYVPLLHRPGFAAEMRGQRHEEAHPPLAAGAAGEAALQAGEAATPCPLILDPVAWLAQAADCPLMDRGLLRDRITPEARALGSSDCDCDAVAPGPPAQRLVFNVFTRRVVHRTAASVRGLALLGIAVDDSTRELCVADPAALQRVVAELRGKRLSWPTMWTRGVLYAKLRHLLCDERVADPAKEVGKLLRQQYDRQRDRSRVGMVSASDWGGRDEGKGESESAAEASATPRFFTPADGDRLLSMADLNEEQQQVVRFVLQGYHTYIGGGAGTGKSVLLRVLKQHLRAEGLSVAVTATTGVASSHVGGCTLHHCFGINLHGSFTRRAELSAYDVIIIDEVSMLPRELFERLEWQLRRANGVDLPFGGVQLILCGDFLQLGAIAAEPILNSPVFRRNFAMLKLRTVMRHGENPIFALQLQALRRGCVPRGLGETIRLYPPSQIRAEKQQQRGLDASDISPAAAGDAADSAATSYVEGAVNLLPTNREVLEINERELARLPGEAVVLAAQLQPPTLVGAWTPTYLLRMASPAKTDLSRLAREVELYLASFFEKTKEGQAPWLCMMGHHNVVLYPLFVDALVLRVRIPDGFDGVTALLAHLESLDSHLAGLALGVRVSEIIACADGLHTEQDEYVLTQYAACSPMAAPLSLKVGARVMLRANLAPGLVNGSIGTVLGFTELSLDRLPRYLAGNAQREAAVQGYIDFLRYEHGLETPLAPVVDFGGGRVEMIAPVCHFVGGLCNTHHYSLSIVALPLSLAYAFTVHKVQGLTLVGRVHLELSRMWPCEHLLYVAMSRVRDPDQLSISSFDERLVCVAATALVFDDSLPSVHEVKLLPHFFQATWCRAPSRRKKLCHRRKLKELRVKQQSAERARKRHEVKKILAEWSAISGV